MISFQELTTFTSIRDWSLTGHDAVVKVVSVEDSARTIKQGSAKGYVTQAKFLAGKNAFQIERDLGLRPESLRRGAYVLYFARLPSPGEVQQRFTAAFPDGSVWTDEKHAEFDRARETYRTSHDTLVQYYPPGSGGVLQWQLLNPVPLSGKAVQVTPSITFHPF